MSAAKLKNISFNLGVFLLFAIFSVLHRSSELAQIATRFVGGDLLDGGIYVFHVRELLESFSWSSWFYVNMLYPFGFTLAYTDSYFLPAVVVRGIMFFTDNLTLAYNLVFFLAWTLNGFCIYLLARHFKLALPLCLFAGLNFQFYPFFVAHTGHPQLQFAFFIPLSLVAALRFLDRPCYRDASIIGASIVASFLCSAYYSLFIVLLMTLTFVGGIVAFRISVNRVFIQRLLVPAIFSGLIFMPFLWPYLEVQNIFHGRPALELKNFSSSLLAYATTPLGNSFLGPETHQWSHFEASSFPGVGLTALLIISLLLTCLKHFRRTTKLERVGYVAIVVCFLVSAGAEIYALTTEDRSLLFWTRIVLLWIPVLLSLILLFSPNQYGIQRFKLLVFLTVFFVVASLGILSIAEINYSIFGVLYNYFPGFGSVRASGRLAVVVQMLLIVITLLLFQQLFRSRPQPVVMWLTVIALATFNFWETRYYYMFESHSDGPRPAIYDQVANLQGVAITLPLQTKSGRNADFVLNQTQYMNWLSGSQLRLVNGYSGNVPRFHRRLVDKLKGFPQRQTLTHLSEITGLNHIIFHGSKVPNFSRESFERELVQVADQLQIVARVGDDYLLSFVPKFTKVSSTLVFPSATHSQELLLFLQSEVSGIAPMAINTSLISKKGEKPKLLSHQEIFLDGTRQLFTLQIPPASQRVYPQIVIINFPEIAAVKSIYLREVAIR